MGATIHMMLVMVDPQRVKRQVHFACHGNKLLPGSFTVFGSLAAVAQYMS